MHIMRGNTAANVARILATRCISLARSWLRFDYLLTTLGCCFSLLLTLAQHVALDRCIQLRLNDVSQDPLRLLSNLLLREIRQAIKQVVPQLVGRATLLFKDPGCVLFSLPALVLPQAILHETSGLSYIEVNAVGIGYSNHV